MKFTFLKLKKNRLPELKSLRPPIFDIEKFWFASLSVGFVILLVTAFIGFQFLYQQYFSTYKAQVSSENYESLINIDKLKDAILKRNNFVNQEFSLPKDPSL